MKKARQTKRFSCPLPASGTAVSVREAKAHFSALVDRAAEGEEITITWHGRARARLAAVRSDAVPFRVNRAWLRSMPLRKGFPRLESLVRADRDARG
jgi:prevent-host-death family protein